MLPILPLAGGYGLARTPIWFLSRHVCVVDAGKVLSANRCNPLRDFHFVRRPTTPPMSLELNPVWLPPQSPCLVSCQTFRWRACYKPVVQTIRDDKKSLTPLDNCPFVVGCAHIFISSSYPARPVSYIVQKGGQQPATILSHKKIFAVHYRMVTVHGNWSSAFTGIEIVSLTSFVICTRK